MKPTETQLRQFWAQCGIYEDADKWWVYPDRLKRRNKPDLSLDSLFRYVLPMVYREVGEDKLTSILQEWVDEVVLHTDFKDSALTLFWMVYRLGHQPLADGEEPGLRSPEAMHFVCKEEP